MAASQFDGLDATTIGNLITAYTAAITALATSESYRFESGGVLQIVTRAQLPEVRITLQELLKARANLSSGGRITHTTAYIRR